MPRKIFVLGHKNPDTDSIVSAIAYAILLRLQGEEDVAADRQGEVWPETRYILDRFDLPLPGLQEDVRPSACGVMTTEPIVGRPNESVIMGGVMSRKKQVVPNLPRAPGSAETRE
jgi:manganese-dependent inorganic pyrophosphatase